MMFVTLCGGIHLCYGDRLKCDFGNVDFNVNQYDSLYTCQVTSLDNSNTINGYNGVHNTNKNVKDVKGIWIHHTNAKYIPENLGPLFNIISFSMSNSNLVEINAKDFSGMQKLEILRLYKNSISYVSLDAFSTLPKLKLISLNYNELREIPSGLFTNNLNLERIDFYGNKIKCFGTGLFNGLTKLNAVDVRENICDH